MQKTKILGVAFLVLVLSAQVLAVGEILQKIKDKVKDFLRKIFKKKSSNSGSFRPPSIQPFKYVQPKFPGYVGHRYRGPRRHGGYGGYGGYGFGFPG